jgi:hypothetical protein
MIRFRRVVAAAIAVVTLSLLLAICGLWIRSNWTTDHFTFSKLRHKFQISCDSKGLFVRVDDLNPATMSTNLTLGANMSAQGRVSLQFSSLYVGLGAPSTQMGPRAMVYATSIEVTQIRYERYGIEWCSGFTAKNAAFPGPFSGCRLNTFGVSFTDLIILSAVLFAGATYIAIRCRKRRPAGHCPRCGYDLRATPDRCPECGYIPLPQISPSPKPSLGS